jgi:hypothetical protein
MFKEVKVRNNWEVLEYSVGDNSLPAQIGEQKIHVQFPDGTEKDVIMEGKKYSRSYNDMGRTYTARGVKLVIHVNVRGIKVEIPLEKVKIWDGE